MLVHLRTAAILLAAFTLLTGVAYPLAFTGLAQIAMPAAANQLLPRIMLCLIGFVLRLPRCPDFRNCPALRPSRRDRAPNRQRRAGENARNPPKLG